MLKKWSILWLIAIVCLPLAAQDPEPEGTRIAWIYDLPGVVAAKGTLVRLAAPVMNQTANKQMVISIAGDSSVPAAFASLLRQRQALTRLRIVEGQAKMQVQTEYILSNVRVRSVAQSQVILGYERIESRAGVGLN